MAKNRIGSLSYSVVLDNNPLKLGLQKARKMMDDHARRERLRQRVRERGGTGAGGSFGRRALDSRFTRMRAGLNARMGGLAQRAFGGTALARVAGAAGPVGIALAGVAVSAVALKKAFDGLVRGIDGVAAEMVQARYQGGIFAVRNRDRAARDALGMSREQAARRGGPTATAQDMLRIGMAQRALEDFRVAMRNTTDVMLSTFAPAIEQAAIGSRVAAIGMQSFFREVRKWIPFLGDPVQNNPANAAGAHRELVRGRLAANLRSASPGGPPSVRGGDASLYQMLQQRQGIQQSEQNRFLSLLLEQGKDQNGILERLLEEMIASDPFKPGRPGDPNPYDPSPM